MDLPDICLRVYPVLEGILIHLSATDASAFLFAARLITKISSETKRRYLNLLRDIPEHMVWIDAKIRNGHKAFIIGNDLRTLRRRIAQPQSENQERSRLYIWLAVIPIHAVTSTIIATDVDETYLMDWNGRVRRRDELHELHGSHHEVLFPYSPSLSDLQSPYLSTMFAPRTPIMRPISDNADHCDWYLSPISNDSDIRVIFMASSSAWNEGLHVHMSTSLSETASPQSNVLGTDQSSVAYFDINDGREGVTHTYSGRVMQRCLNEGFVPIIITLGPPLNSHYGDENKEHWVVPAWSLPKDD
ncbi:hypothetical protein BDP55DRAFT_639257 [Colletotrichum godetiae]|uniref:Uncharacterized protein n=1 Tax=Colletotrichum godetiae TaxID=1209918 RepID=A0AAJ0EMS7_9PEZI|nr:uncharacterized protein BDP55DRAFT_639257 [Colletotrichum godetiae]KAK1656867.1 hypothetical protein BDP55DRAFT_639257 [Colletotrichum godetiae]